MHLAYITGIEPATSAYQADALPLSYTDDVQTYGDVLPLLLRHLLDHVIQHAAFLSSRELLRSFSRPALRMTLPLTVQTAPEPLIAKISDSWRYPFSYRLAGWYCSGVGTTRYSPLTCVPLRAHRQAFFPLRQLRRYLHRFGSAEGHLAVLSRLA